MALAVAVSDEYNPKIFIKIPKSPWWLIYAL